MWPIIKKAVNSDLSTPLNTLINNVKSIVNTVNTNVGTILGTDNHYYKGIFEKTNLPLKEAIVDETGGVCFFTKNDISFFTVIYNETSNNFSLKKHGLDLNWIMSSSTTSGRPRAMAADETDVYVAYDKRVKRFATSNFGTNQQTPDHEENVWSVAIGGGYVFSGEENTIAPNRVTKYTKSLSKVAESPTIYDTISCLYTEGDYLYVGGYRWNQAVSLKRFNISDLTLAGAAPSLGGSDIQIDMKKIVSDENYVYLLYRMSSYIYHLKKYDKFDLDLVGGTTLGTNIANADIDIDENYIYALTVPSSGAAIVSVRDKATLSEVDTMSNFTNVGQIIVEPNYIYGKTDTGLIARLKSDVYTLLGYRRVIL